MNKIESLIEELCPQGILHCQLGEVAELKRGTSITKTQTEPGEVPVIAGGQTPAYWHNVPNRTGETIVVAGSGAYAGFVSYWDIPIFVSDAFTVTPKDKSVISRYLFHFLLSKQPELHKMKQGSGVPHVYPKDAAKLKIPLPPTPIQQEIVSILDKFTELEAELQAELESRRKQYEQYRNKLLSTHLPTDVEFKTLRELIGPITRGKRLTKSNLAEVGSIPVFHGGLSPIGYHDKSNSPGETVMIINTGASSGSVGWSKAPFWCSDGCFALPHSKEFSSRYIYHYASLNEQFFMDKVRKAGIPTLASESVYSLPIPVLPMVKQLEIAGTLDAFLELTSNHSIGVPAEITSRRQQYEYYRNKLLTFKELKES
jgi:type I restriction enzyme S subunit